MDKTEAINRLEDLVKTWDGDPFVQKSVDAFKLAITALREQEQREQECEFCGGRHIITSVTVRHSMVGYDDVLGKVKVNFTETLKPPKEGAEG